MAGPGEHSAKAWRLTRDEARRIAANKLSCRTITVGWIIRIVAGSYCRFWEKLSQYPVWI